MKVYKVRWTPDVKRAAILFLLAIFLVGAMVGFFIGKLVFQVNATDTTSLTATTQPGVVTPEVVLTVHRTQPDTHPAEEPLPSLPPAPTEPPVLYYDCPLDHDFQDYIRKLCETHNVPMGLVIAMIDRESNFRASVISGTDDYGLMQINTINHGWLSEQYGLTDFLDPYQNVFAGVTILSDHLERYDGDLAKALMAYNMGATGAKRLWNQGIYSTKYTEYILSAMDDYNANMTT